MGVSVIKKCSNCYWCQEKEFGAESILDHVRITKVEKHTGCYAGGQWRKWLSKKKLNIPNECPSWKNIPEVVS